MKTNNNDGFIEELVLFVIVAFFVVCFVSLFCVRFEASEQSVSGIVYNTQNSAALSGNTYFSVRAAVDTYVSQENQSSYCLPPHSPYIALLNKAAANKNIKVDVTTKKYFAIQAPWTCKANVTVTEEK